MIKKTIKRFIPVSLLSRMEHAREFSLDRKRYMRNSAPSDDQASVRLGGRNLEAQLTKDYHRVEKGLALRDPKRPFGVGVLQRLDMLIPVAEVSSESANYVSFAQSARSALIEWNEGMPVMEDVSPVRKATVGGIDDLREFFGTRRSTRDFDERAVSLDDLVEAVELAINTPSVCNRQAWHVRFQLESEDIVRSLAFQNGNSGFTENIPALAIVTVDARLFAGSGERNQGWIEGGLFSMSLVWALHGMGLDSCMLNMSLPNRRTDALRKEMDIPDNELVIMMIAIGYGREGHRVARSPRRNVAEVIR
ncbi:nitroreductase family protein [Pseudarthrobacter oxydans]|uniref:nitroreductase family protein n=1 Tax=Pseudarthrobacter oxydans TaxID=1671 RepID=UPI0034227017